MIPGVLAPPAPSPRATRPGRSARLVGVALIGLAAVGAAVWLLLLSPYGYRRADISGIPSVVPFRQSGLHIIYVEYAGATDAPADAARPEIVIRSQGGRRVAVRPLRPAADGAVPTYAVPGHEGRAVAEVTIESPGNYQVGAYELAEPGAADSLPAGAELAIARDTSATWLGSWWGLVPFVVLPALAGVASLVLAAVQRRSASL